MSKIIFVTGGARSGKSAFAQELAENYKDVAYVATAEITDPEMQERVRMHLKMRPENWTTYEAQKDISKVFLENNHDVFLVDCMTVYISNAVVGVVSEDDELIDTEAQNRTEDSVMREIREVIEIVRKKDLTVIFVSNEVGMGLVPAYPMGRMFRDIVGRANKIVASAADEVFLVVAGIPMRLKG